MNFNIFMVFQLAQDAYICEEKEEKLANDAVQQLTQANLQIQDLHDQFNGKVNSLILIYDRNMKVKNYFCTP